MSHGESFLEVLALHEDVNGSLWIGTKFGGLAKWNPRTWSFGHTRASPNEGFSEPNITSFAEDKMGRATVLRRIERRMQVNGQRDLMGYRDFLRATPDTANVATGKVILTMTEEAAAG